MEQLLWDTAEHARHSVRVICDDEGLSWDDKNDLCGTIGAESEWLNIHPDGRPVKHDNYRKDGSLGSTDWGIVQVNDRFHIGPGLDFPSVQYVLNNPEKAVRWMCHHWKLGHRNWWYGYSTGRYKKYL